MKRNWKVRQVYGRKALFCCDACYEGFREDRGTDLIYPAVQDENGGIWTWEAASKAFHWCAYCREVQE